MCVCVCTCVCACVHARANTGVHVCHDWTEIRLLGEISFCLLGCWRVTSMWGGGHRRACLCACVIFGEVFPLNEILSRCVGHGGTSMLYIYTIHCLSRPGPFRRSGNMNPVPNHPLTTPLPHHMTSTSCFNTVRRHQDSVQLHSGSKVENWPKFLLTVMLHCSVLIWATQLWRHRRVDGQVYSWLWCLTVQPL